MRVPEVLLSGHHENIRRWRLQMSLERTKKHRPELLDAKDIQWDEHNRREERGVREEGGGDERDQGNRG
jgi:tRNA (guanine-N1)-methyltransferase